MDKRQYDNITERADAGGRLTLDEVRDAVDWAVEKGVVELPGMDARGWLQDVQVMLEAMGR